MGFLKKLTRPISRVLDKIVPNEIKPALPFLAAAVPFLAPTSGIFGTMAGRAALSGGANLLAQLSQEGSEGDFNPLTALLATGTGALSAPRIGFGTNPGVSPAEYFGTRAGLASEGTGIMSKASELGFTGLEKGARFLSAAEGSGGAGDILRPGGTKAGLDLATAQAVTLPATTGTMDLAFAETNRLNKQQIIDDALGGLGEGASDADRALAIRLAMQQYGFTDDEISETIESAGYKDGGIIGLQVEMIEGKKDGGRVNLREGGVLAQILPKFQPTLGSIQPFMGRPAFAPTLQQAEAVFPRLNQLEQGINTAEQDLGRIRERLGDQPRQLMSASQGPLGLQQFTPSTNMLSIAQLANRGDVPQGMKEGGLMDLGGKEMDLRGGGFVPIGKKEKADDVPARLSKNEFVMTADAVRAAGGGSVNKGAKRMYDLMDRLEARA